MRKFHFLIDADTLLYRCSSVQQECSIQADNPYLSKYSGQYKNITTLKSVLQQDGVEFIKDDWDISENIVITGSAYNIVKSFKWAITRITSHPECADYSVFLGGSEGNFRRDVAETLPYKGKRSNKPLLLDEAISIIKVSKFDEVCNKVKIPITNIEADDLIGITHNKMQQAWLDGKSELIPCIAAIDKDLLSISGYHLNYDDTDAEIFFVTESQAVRNFLVQMIIGDSTDNIPSCYYKGNLPKKSYEYFSKKPLNYKGIGKEKANELFNGLSIPQMFELVFSMYTESYGENWIKRCTENAKLLRMLRTHKEDYDIFEDYQRYVKMLGEANAKN